MAEGKDLLLRVRFAGFDGVSKTLFGIRDASKTTGRALAETNRALRDQNRELLEVQRGLAKGSGNVTELVNRERTLEHAIEASNAQLVRRKRLMDIDRRTAGFREIGERWKSSGQQTLLSMTLLAAPLVAMAHAGAEFESLQNRMKVLGLGHGAVDELTAFARAMNVAGSSVNENMRYLLEAQGVFRETGEHNLADQLAGAKLMAPLLAKMHVAALSMGKEIGEEQERYFLRFIEQAGGLANPKRAAELTDGLFRALQSSGGNVQAGDYQSFLARAGIAGSHLSNRSMFADFEPLIAELHEQAGVGLATGFKMATGIKVNSRAAAEFMRLGLWDEGKVTLNSLGGVKTTKGNPLNERAAMLLQHDPVEFYRQMVMPAYAKNGITTSEGRAFENAKIFGGTGGNLFNLIDKQLPTILRSREAYRKTENLDQAYNQTNDSFFGSQGKLKAAGKDFLVATGTKGGLLDNITSLMTSATAALRAFTAFGNAHPTAFRWLGKIVTDLILMRAGFAVAQIAFGGLLGPVAAVLGMFQKLRVAGEFATAFPRIAAATRLLGVALGFLRTGAITTMAIASPMVVTFVGIGIAVAGAAYLIYRNWGGISRFFGRVLSGMKAAFSLTFLDLWRPIAYFAAYGLGALYRFGGRAAAWARTLPHLLGSAFSRVFDSWMAVFRFQWVTLPRLFGNLGLMIVQGLWNGIKSAPGRIWNAGKALAHDVVAGFKAGAGIRSPSRVFAELGGYLMRGLSIGIDRGSDGPLGRTRAVVRRLSAAMALAAAPAMTGAATPQLLRANALSRGPVIAAPLLELAAPETRPAIVPGAFGSGKDRTAPAPLALAPSARPSIVHHHNETINIHLPAGVGPSAADQARALMTEIRRIQAARDRSSYEDRD